MRFVYLALALLSLSMPARAEEIVLGLSQDEVAITATFEGSHILIFGAIKRDGTETLEGDLGVIITVSGPKEPITVRRKERRYGIWVNADAVEVDAAPSYYAVSTSGPLDAVLKDIEDLRHSITIPRAIRSVGAKVEDSEAFTEALIRIRSDARLYSTFIGTVDLEEDTLFRTAINLPSNITEGDYETRIFLTRGGVVVDEYDTIIPVEKVGIERWLYRLAQDNAVLYGILSLMIAVAAGWGASAAFAALRR
jgi:uncharacterized protein (TIGR02186 family)